MRFWHKFSTKFKANLGQIQALNFTQIFGVKIKFSENLHLNLNEIYAKFKEFLRNLCENFGLNKIFGLNLKTPKFSENLHLNLNEIHSLNSAINSINLSPAKPYFYALYEISLLSKYGKIGREVER